MSSQTVQLSIHQFAIVRQRSLAATKKLAPESTSRFAARTEKLTGDLSFDLGAAIDVDVDLQRD